MDNKIKQYNTDKNNFVGNIHNVNSNSKNNFVGHMNTTNTYNKNNLFGWGIFSEITPIQIYQPRVDDCYSEANKKSLKEDGINTDKSNVSYDGLIESFTDYQSCFMSNACASAYGDFYDKNQGKTFLEIYKAFKEILALEEELSNILIDGDYYAEQMLIDKINKLKEEYGYDQETLLLVKSYIENGIGNFKIVEYVNDEDTGFNVCVLEDTDGNYLVNYTCTAWGDMKDYIYDASIVLGVDTSSSEYLDFFNEQLALAEKFAERYREEAAKKGKKIHINGYSLGGSLAEKAYLSICDKPNVGGLSVYEPLHANLDDVEVDKLVQQHELGNVKIFANQGSFVSACVSYDEIDAITDYIYVDYEKSYDQEIQETTLITEADVSFLKWIINKFDYVMNSNLTDVIDNEIAYINKIWNAFSNAMVFIGDVHSWSNPEAFENISFDEHGNVKKVVSIVDENGNNKNINVDGKKFNELMEEIFNLDLTNEREIISKIAQFLVDHADTIIDAGKITEDMYLELINLLQLN